MKKGDKKITHHSQLKKGDWIKIENTFGIKKQTKEEFVGQIEYISTSLFKKDAADIGVSVSDTIKGEIYGRDIVSGTIIVHKVKKQKPYYKSF